MATTALIINDQKMLIMTVARENGVIDVDIFLGDDDFLPTGTASLGMCPQSITEEEYHKTLRAQAHEKGQYVPEASSNNEWNPGEPELPREDS